MEENHPTSFPKTLRMYPSHSNIVKQRFGLGRKRTIKDQRRFARIKATNHHYCLVSMARVLASRAGSEWNGNSSLPQSVQAEQNRSLEISEEKRDPPKLPEKEEVFEEEPLLLTEKKESIPLLPGS